MPHGSLYCFEKGSNNAFVDDRYKTMPRAVGYVFKEKLQFCKQYFFVYGEIRWLFINSDGKTFPTAFTKISH